MSEIQPTREDAHMEIGVSFRHNPKIYSARRHRHPPEHR